MKHGHEERYPSDVRVKSSIARRLYSPRFFVLKLFYSTYVSTGSRSFGDNPITPYARPVWEIYAVIQGRLAPRRAEEPEIALQERTLWIFPPGSVHGWSGEPGKTAQIAVFHFDCVPDELRELTAALGYAQVSLEEEEGLLVARLAREILPHLWKKDALLKFHATRTLMDLVLLIIGKSAGPSEDAANTEGAGTADASDSRVDAAENWFRIHLPQCPTLMNLSCATGITEGHLRRLFHAERGCSPKEAMTKIQMARAEELLTQTDLKLEVVAVECGFTRAQYLCKAFKEAYGMTPMAYRKAKAKHR